MSIKLTAGVNFINILCKGFTHTDSKSLKIQWSCYIRCYIRCYCAFEICAHKKFAYNVGEIDHRSQSYQTLFFFVSWFSQTFIFSINFLGVTRIRTYIWHGSDHESSKLATGLTDFIEAEHAPLSIDKWKSRRY